VTDKVYSISVTEEQLRVIQKALEDFFRTRYCQFFDLVDDLAFANFDLKKSEAENIDEKEFSRRIERRNEAQAMFDAAGRVARPYAERTRKTQDCMIAEDVWAVIRHELYKEKCGEKENVMDVRSYPPILISGEDPVLLKRLDAKK